MKISKKRAIVTVILLGLILSIFSCILMVMSYNKMRTVTYVHTEKLNTISTVRKLNYALGFGKPLEKFYGLNALLKETKELSDNIQGIEILNHKDAHVEVFGHMSGKVKHRGIGEEYVAQKDGIYVFCGFDAGMMVLRLKDDMVLLYTRQFIHYLAPVAGLILLALLFITILSFTISAREGIGIKRMRITALLILICSQTVLGGLSIRYMDRSWQDSVEQIAASAARMVEDDINAVIDKGVSYQELTGIDAYLENIVSDIPELSDISIGEHTAKTSNQSASFNLAIKGTEESDVNLSCYYDQNLIKSNRRNNIIDSAIVLLITIFITLETVNFLTKHMALKGTRKKEDLYLPGFRLFVFVMSMAFTMDVGFFSVLSKKLFFAMELPDSMSFLSGMPNTMYSAAVLIGLLGASSLIRRIGMKKIITAGLIFGILGYVFCALSPNLPLLIVSRFIYGLCDGIIINSIRLYASAQKDADLHKKILVEYMAAANLGVSCGVVIGGLLADAVSYTAVFLAGAALGVVCIFLAWFAGFPGKQEQAEQMSFLSALKEIKRPQVLVFMIFVVLPVYIATLFVGYTFPLFGDEAAFSNSMVSGCLMVNFIIIAYLTDPIADKALKLLPPRLLMAVYMFLQTISIGLFVVTGTAWAAFLALVLTSLWDCFGMVAMDMGLDHVEGTTTEKCTLLQMIFGKAGMIIGPVAITSQLARGAAGATGVIVGLLTLGLLVYVLSLILFKKQSGSQPEI